MDSLIAAADSAMYESKHGTQCKATLSDAKARSQALNGSWVVFDAAHLTGVKIIDDQHRQIVQMVNDLNRSLEEGRDDAELKRLFGALLAFTASHFATEEAADGAPFGYPQDGRASKTQHENLVHELQVDCRRVQPGCGTAAMLQSIKDWLLGHIQHADKPLGTYLTSLNTTIDL
jgi:hemerythrin-like metal-binding protein